MAIAKSKGAWYYAPTVVAGRGGERGFIVSVMQLKQTSTWFILENHSPLWKINNIWAQIHEDKINCLAIKADKFGKLGGRKLEF
jgi:hypothetical protein